MVKAVLEHAHDLGFELGHPMPDWPRRGRPLLPGHDRLIRIGELLRACHSISSARQHVNCGRLHAVRPCRCCLYCAEDIVRFCHFVRISHSYATDLTTYCKTVLDTCSWHKREPKVSTYCSSEHTTIYLTACEWLIQSLCLSTWTLRLQQPSQQCSLLIMLGQPIKLSAAH